MLPGKQNPRRGCRGHLSNGKLSAVLLIFIALGALGILLLNRRPPAEKQTADMDTNVAVMETQPAAPVPEAPVAVVPSTVQPAAPVKSQQASAPTANLIRIAMLYNATKFIGWPANAFQDAGAPFVIGMFGAQSFSDQADKEIAGRKAAGRSIIVKYLGPAKTATATEWKGCHVLFLPASEASEQTRIIQAVKGLPILSAGENETFLQAGGIVAFPARDGYLKFQLSEVAAKEAGLTPSPRLLKTALKWPPK
jgi:hypothetical protein